MKDSRENIKVKPGVRRLVNLLAAHLELSQSEIIENLAKDKCRELKLPVKD